VRLDHGRAAALGVDAEDLGRALAAALEGLEVGDLVRGERAVPVRLRIAGRPARDPEALGDIVVRHVDGAPVRLREVADITIADAPARIQRDRQQRIVEVAAGIAPEADPEAVMAEVRRRLADLELPEGYALYEAGALEALRAGRRLGGLMLGLAVFLVFVVMAVQYESLRNPAIILASVPFAAVGVAAGLWVTGMPLSMPVWLGLIMLAGIVVNNAIVLVEQVEIERRRGLGLEEALLEASGNRLRPILMMVWGLAFSTVVTLALIPALYRIVHGRAAAS